jgi:hypothetical protein
MNSRKGRFWKRKVVFGTAGESLPPFTREQCLMCVRGQKGGQVKRQLLGLVR